MLLYSVFQNIHAFGNYYALYLGTYDSIEEARNVRDDYLRDDNTLLQDDFVIVRSRLNEQVCINPDLASDEDVEAGVGS